MYENNKDIGWKKKNSVGSGGSGSYDDTLIKSKINTLNKEMDDLQKSVFFVNVESFGAKGDGVTDDTSAIRSAIEYAVNNKLNKVVFNKGTYLISSIDIPSFICIEMQSGTNIVTNSETEFAFNCNNVTNVVISGGIISGGFGAVRCVRSQKIKIEGLTVYNTKNGVTCKESDTCIINSNTFDNINGDISGSIGVTLYKTNNSIVTDNRINNTGQDSILVYDESRNCIISNNICTDWNRENDMGRASIQAYWTDHVIICDNLCYGVNHLEFGIGANETGIRARDCDYIKIDNNLVKNCYASGIENILLNDTNGKFTQKHTTITNNTIEDVGQYGISSMGTVANAQPAFTIISNNIIDGVKWMYTNGTGVGILSKDNNCIISSNIVRNVGDMGIGAYGKIKIIGNFIENAGVYNDGNVGVMRVGIFATQEGVEILFNTISHTMPSEECPMKKGIMQTGNYSYYAFGNILYNDLLMSTEGTNMHN